MLQLLASTVIGAGMQQTVVSHSIPTCAGAGLTEMSAAEVGFDMSRPTLLAGNLLNDSRIVQVSRAPCLPQHAGIAPRSSAWPASFWRHTWQPKVARGDAQACLCEGILCNVVSAAAVCVLLAHLALSVPVHTTQSVGSMANLVLGCFCLRHDLSGITQTSAW